MKNKKIYTVIGILVFISSFIILENSITYNGKKNGTVDYYPFLSDPDSIEEIWNRTWIAGDNYSSNLCYAVELDSLGNIYLGGSLYNTVTNDREIALVKYDKNGVYQWNRTWNTRKADICYDIAIDSSNNIYVGGYTLYGGSGSDRSVILIKYTQDGVQEWNRTWHVLSEECKAISIDSSDNILLAGSVDSYDKDYQILLLMYNSTGDVVWQSTWGGDGNDHGNGIVLDSSNNIYISGTSNNSVCLVKFNSSGVEQWNSTFIQYREARGIDIALDSSNNIFIAGTIDWDQMCLIKFDSSGTFQLNRTWSYYGGEMATAILIDSLDNVYLIGAASQAMCLVKYSNSGILQWDLYYTLNDFEAGIDGVIDSLGNFYIVGYRRTGFNVVDYYLIKFHTVPIISIHSPKLNELFGEVAPEFNISIITDSINASWYSINDGNTNIFFSGSTGNINQAAWTIIDDGQVLIQFFTNNSAGYVGSRNITVIKDTLSPQIIINSPTPYQFFGETAPTFNISINESHLDTAWYTLDYGSTNITFNGDIIQINQSEWDKKTDGLVTLQFYANDTLGYLGFKEINLTKDSTLPQITINSPNPSAYFKEIPTNYDITIVEVNLDTTWYSLDHGLTNITFSGSTGQINQLEWDKTADGVVALQFYAKDSAGNIAYSEVIINKDAVLGQITINSPTLNQFFGAIAPNFDLDIGEYHLNTTWYTLDDGLTNITFSGFTGQINQSEWDKKGDGTAYLRFFANSTLGNEGSSSVFILKDLIAPTSSISFIPYEGTNTVSKSTTFTLTSDDGTGAGVSIIKYKINNSDWVDYNGPFELSEYDYGDYLISYYSIDNVDNTEVENSITVKLVPLTGTPPIPGFDISILISVMGLISVLVIMKRRKFKIN